MKTALLTAVAVLLCSKPLAAAPEPIVRAEMTPEVVTVGQKVQLRITVLVPTWFKGPPSFPTFEIASAITRLPPDSSYPTSKTVEGERWSGIIREYEIYPLAAARYQLSPQTFHVEFVDPGDRSTVTADVEVPLPEFRAVVPSGAENLDPFLSGTELELERVVDTDQRDFEVGDALVVRTIAKLKGMPAIFIPPLVEAVQANGLSVYPEQPIVEDDKVARREEAVTYVFERGGRYTVPSIAVEWWNTDTEEIEAATLPPMELAVEGPSMIVADVVASDRTPVAIAVVVFGLILSVGFARYRVGTSIAEWRRRKLEEWHASEAYAFRQIGKVARSGDRVRFYEAILQWLERFEPGTTTAQLAARGGIEELDDHIQVLSRSLYEQNEQDLDLVEIQRLLASARKAILSERKRSTRQALPPLNPLAKKQ